MTTEPTDWHDAPWAQQARQLDLEAGKAALDAVAVLLSRPDTLCDSLTAELTVFQEAVQNSSPALSTYTGPNGI